MNALVSTLICTYNASKFITWTIKSVLDQKYRNQEILIWDDWSNDDTLSILNNYRQKDKRIKIYTAEEMGKRLWPYWWLNFLMDRATGDYIAIQDHDDIWHPDKLSIQVGFLDKNRDYVGSGTTTLMYFGKSKVWYIVDNDKYDADRVIHTSLVFRNHWFRYDATNVFLCDSDFMLRILTKRKLLLRIIPQVLTLHYYKETNSNYSELRFKLTTKNIVRYFSIYWISLYSFFSFIYTILIKFLPPAIKGWLSFKLSLRNKLKDRHSLILDHRVKEMLNYIAE